MKSASNIPKYPHLRLALIGEDGNAFAILGRARRLMLLHKCSEVQIESFFKEAQSGDYDHLLQTCMRYFNCDWDDEYGGSHDKDALLS